MKKNAVTLNSPSGSSLCSPASSGLTVADAPIRKEFEFKTELVYTAGEYMKPLSCLNRTVILWTSPGSWDARPPAMAFCGHTSLPCRVGTLTALRLAGTEAITPNETGRPADFFKNVAVWGGRPGQVARVRRLREF